MKKILKIFAIAVGLCLLTGILWFANALVGNPISRAIIHHQATKYVAETYADTDYALDEVTYSFKTGYYYARIVSPSSLDGDFSVSYNWHGKFGTDRYETQVTEKRNTYQRLGMEMRTAAEELYAQQLPQYEILNALFDFEEGEMSIEETSESLTLNMELDLQHAPLPLRTSITISDPDVSYEKVAEVLRALAEICQNENIPIVNYSVRIEYDTLVSVEDGAEAREMRQLSLYDIPTEILGEEDLATALQLWDEQTQ